ncbi:hypothetical protein FA13DRAFT_1718714 [Coprinellus micaceus]|uniref:Uncharacterized protein n=1 Tax=Coprinellus micaceus TaxID=71717 RepID=A0A4Y7SCT7_COPMI|nr:hypothetical protein FA13DRAFT_1718714 [Coprinellus micaceus]
MPPLWASLRRWILPFGSAVLDQLKCFYLCRRSTAFDQQGMHPVRPLSAYWYRQVTTKRGSDVERKPHLRDAKAGAPLRLMLVHQMHSAKTKPSKATSKLKVRSSSSKVAKANRSRPSKRAEKLAADPDDIENFPAPPRLSIQPSQLKFLMICSVYLREAQAEGQDEEFLDQFFNRVYHPRWPIPRHEFFCEEAADHAKGVLFKFAGSVAVNMTWEEFVVLGERGLSRDKGFGEELERIRLVLRGSSGLNSLTFVQNACDGSGSNKEGDR